MPTALLNGVELYYEVTGTGDDVVLTHGSWTDADGWSAAVDALADQYRVVTWDRRGHSRSKDGEGPGSRAEDAADLATLIDHVGDGPVHLVGNSYGSTIALTLVTTRPDLVATAALHEPPLFDLLENSADQAINAALTRFEQHIDIVVKMIEAGNHAGSAEYFVDNVALGPGAWTQLPDTRRSIMVANAATYLDELADPSVLSIEADALATTTVPLLFTQGTESPPLFQAVIEHVASLVPSALMHTYDGAGHLPHATHTEVWASRLIAFHHQAGADNSSHGLE